MKQFKKTVGLSLAAWLTLSISIQAPTIAKASENILKETAEIREDRKDWLEHFVYNSEKIIDTDNIRYGDIGAKLRHFKKDEANREQLDQEIFEMATKVNFNEEEVNSNDEESNSTFTYDGGTKRFSDGRTFTLRSVGNYAEVWVADDLAYLDDRPTPVITQEQVDKVRDEFDTNIYPTMVEFFGTPDSHTGENATLSNWDGVPVPEGYYVSEDGVERVIILVDNIRDGIFYDPDSENGIGGIYKEPDDDTFDRNIITLSARNWETIFESYYLGTVAHEFQHLIQADVNNTTEEPWIKEGMAHLAQYLCGYGHPMGHVNFFLEHPENSLVAWYDQSRSEIAADYGQAYLFQLYLYEQYGENFIKMLFQDEKSGVTSLNNVLGEFGVGIDFDELFRRFTIALAIDSPEVENGIYNFNSIDLNVNYEAAATNDKDGVPAWGADYKVIDNGNKIQSIKFSDIDFLTKAWAVKDDPNNPGNSVLWGGEGHDEDNQLTFEADLTHVESATLTFDNYIDIDDQWDFGIVQVSVDNGETWISLQNENTSDPRTFDPGYRNQDIIMDNLPGLTGYYDDWNKEFFDLTPFVGQNILINFRYMTDAGINGSGWFIDNIEIPEIGYNNDGASTDDFIIHFEQEEILTSYSVTFINEKSLGVGSNEQNYRVLNIEPFNVTESDDILLEDFFSGGNNYMIIWYTPPEGVTDAVPYTYEITNKE
ncbi:immune inhibitor A domain-containing protein [Bacillus sp. SM2101]|uniref:immune inhibitor A domain-containing protein n=1 Tax=Bacillus sp. SM2101 TaxID=2805366 RepID=UPI001BDE901C|nr:immune inhibitor A domain-containing protein [Bacillus sp. SM2101]